MYKKGLAVGAFIIIVFVFFMGFISYNNRLQENLGVLTPNADHEEERKEDVLKTVKVPDLLGATIEEVRLLLEEYELIGVIGEEYTDRSEKGLVFHQSPNKNLLVEKGSKVYFTLSLGPFGSSEKEKTFIMPNFIGMTEEEVRNVAEELGLFVEISYRESTTTSSGTVLSQDPSKGVDIKEGTAITIVLPQEPEPQRVNVPSVVGQQRNAAVEILKNAGFMVTVREVDSTTQNVGKVLTQNPSAQGTATKGSTVTISVGKKVETPMVTVPSVLGQTRANAVEALEKLGLVVRIQEQESTDENIGKVLGQNPSANTSMEKGATVTLTVGKKAEVERVLVPSVVGQDRGKAEETLRDLGFIVVVQEEESTENQVGKVLRQQPGPEESLVYGSTVTLHVGIQVQSEMITVMDVMGLSEEEAVAKLESQGFVVKIERRTSAFVDVGIVMEQKPSAGTSLAKGAEITLVISRGVDGN